jgi:hypothetical protein
MQPHFDLTEAKNLVAFCAQLEGPTPPLAAPLIPANWTAVFTSPEMGAFDNKWQLWKNSQANEYAVVIRGTVGKPGSVILDLMSVMIPASGILPVGSVALPYKLAEDPKAAVHLGFALGMCILLYDSTNGIIAKLSGLPAGAGIFVAGHSQGASIATLCRSFLRYSPILAAKNFTYKSYLYAQAKPGNDHYGWDFGRVTSNTNSGYSVTNSQDWVPQVPLTIQLLGSLNEPNPLDYITGNVVFEMLSKSMEAMSDHIADEHIKKHLPQFSILEQVLKKQNFQAVGVSPASASIEIRPTLNFVVCGTPIILAGTPGTNPTDPKDFFWQHHAAMYYNLLGSVYP